MRKKQSDPAAYELKLRKLRTDLKDDLLAFGYTVCPSLTTSKTNCPVHSDIAEFHKTKPRYAAVIAPRGHSKTTWGSTIAVLHDIAYDTEDVILIIKRTFTAAVIDLRNIIEQVKYNRRFKALYGKREFLIDRQEKVYVYNPVTKKRTWIEAKGTNQSVRGIVVGGSRVTKIIMDDFEDELNTSTQELRDKIKAWIAGQVFPSLDPDKGKILVLGTIVHYDSWLNNLLETNKDNKNSNWKISFHQVIENGEPIWPERFSKEYIAQIKSAYEELGMPDKFYQEYYNIPISREDNFFKVENFKYASFSLKDKFLLEIEQDGVKTLKTCDVVAAVDPSTGTSTDFTGIAVTAKTSDGNIYVVHASKLKLTPDKIVETIITINNIYKPRTIIVESTAFQSVISFWIKSINRETGLYVPVTPKKSVISKEMRIIGTLQPLYSSGKIYHDKNGGSSEIEKELLVFPKGKNDDLIDALQMAVSSMITPEYSDAESMTSKKGIVYGYNWKTGERELVPLHRMELPRRSMARPGGGRHGARYSGTHVAA